MALVGKYLTVAQSRYILLYLDTSNIHKAVRKELSGYNAAKMA
jgi:hypothetical protein